MNGSINASVLFAFFKEDYQSVDFNSFSSNIGVPPRRCTKFVYPRNSLY